jgi:hypothetical protein
LVQETVLGKKEQRRTILKVFKEHNENAKKLVGIDFAPCTVERYETSYKHTRDFIRWRYKGKTWLWMISTNSTTKYLKNFKSRTSGNRQGRFSLDSQKTAENKSNEYHFCD